MTQETMALLREGRFEEAALLCEERLRLHDDDHETRLELGLIRLAGGDRRGFLEIHAMYAPCLRGSALDRLGGRLRALWERYAAIGRRLCATAAVGAAVASGALVLEGCDPRRAATPPAAGEPGAGEVAPMPGPVSAPAPVIVPAEPVAEPAPPPPAPRDAATEPEAKEKPQVKQPPPHPADFPRNRYIAVHFDDKDKW